MIRTTSAMTVALATSLIAGPLAATAVGGACPACSGDADSETGIEQGGSRTLRPNNPEAPMGAFDRFLEVVVEFENGPDSEPATVCACWVTPNPNPPPGPLGYLAHVPGATLSIDVSFETASPLNTYKMRVSMPFNSGQIPPESLFLGEEATELTTYNISGNDNAWVLAVSENTSNSPGFGDAVGDRFRRQPPDPTSIPTDEIGDYGVYWDGPNDKGFVWANVNHANDFAVGSPLCWADVNGVPPIDAQDLIALLGAWGPCELPDPPVGCTGDIFFDGEVNVRDLATLLAFWQEPTCFLPPEDAFINHSVASVDNTAGDGEWGTGAAGDTHFTWDLQVETDPDTPDLNAWTTSELRDLGSPETRIDAVYDAVTFFQHPDELTIADFLHLGQILGWPPTNFLPNPFPNCDNRDSLAFDSYFIEASDMEPCIGNTAGTWPGATNLNPYSQSDSALVATWFYQATFGFLPPAQQPATIARFTMVVDRTNDPGNAMVLPGCPDCGNLSSTVDIDLVASGSSPDPVIGTIKGVSTHRFGVSNLIPFSFDLIDVCGADINDDGTVDTVDLLAMLAGWNFGGSKSDLNRDGVTDVVDLLRLLARWGVVCPPPPSSAKRSE